MSDHRKSAKLWMERGSGVYLAGMSDYKDALKADIRKRIKDLKSKEYKFRNNSAVDLYAAEELQKLLRSLDTIDPL